MSASSVSASEDFNLSELIGEHYEMIYRFAVSRTRNIADAEDLTQQAFVALIRHFHQIRERSRIKSWLLTTIVRLHLRQIARNRLPSEEHRTYEIEDFVIDSTAGYDGQVLRLALRKLKPSYREPIELFYFQSLSYKEIAGRIGVPIGTVMSRISRGKIALRRQMNK